MDDHVPMEWNKIQNYALLFASRDYASTLYLLNHDHKQGMAEIVVRVIYSDITMPNSNNCSQTQLTEVPISNSRKCCFVLRITLETYCDHDPTVKDVFHVIYLFIYLLFRFNVSHISSVLSVISLIWPFYSVLKDCIPSNLIMSLVYLNFITNNETSVYYAPSLTPWIWNLTSLPHQKTLTVYQQGEPNITK